MLKWFQDYQPLIQVNDLLDEDISLKKVDNAEVPEMEEAEGEGEEEGEDLESESDAEEEEEEEEDELKVRFEPSEIKSIKSA